MKSTTKNGRRKVTDYKPMNGGAWIRPCKRLAIYLRDGFSCGYCGTDLRDGKPSDITLDHLVARSVGGNNKETNLVTCCRSCNSQRQEKDWTKYATGGAIERINVLRRLPLNLQMAKALSAGKAANPALEAQR
jgi:5-methylcytosine-specific restriction endonuclease McrA